MYETSSTMYKDIYGEERAHTHIAISFNNLGLVYNAEGKLEEVVIMHQSNIEMNQAIYVEESAHLNIATSF